MGKKKDPSKGVVGRGHQVLPALRSGGGDPPKGDGAKGHLVLPAIRMGSSDPSEGGGRTKVVLPALGSGSKGHQPGKRRDSGPCPWRRRTSIPPCNRVPAYP